MDENTERRRAEYEKIVRRQLELLGEDPSRTGLARTPYRVARSMAFLTRGYEVTLKDAVGAGDVKVEGAEGKLEELMSYMDNFDFWFPIVTP